MVSRRTLITPLLAALLTLFTVACDGSAAPTSTPSPTRPVATETISPTNTQTPTATRNTPTATNTPTIELSPTPDIVNFPIIVECPPPACTPGELTYYNKRFREEFDYLTNLFGIRPTEQIVFVGSYDEKVDELKFLFTGSRSRSRVWKTQIDSPDNQLTHELLHAVLDTPVDWYDEGLANVSAQTNRYISLLDSANDLGFYEGVKKDKKIAEISPQNKGRIFFYVLRRDYGWNPTKDTVPKQLYDNTRHGIDITEDYIFDLYQNSLGRDLAELREIISYYLVVK